MGLSLLIVGMLGVGAVFGLPTLLGNDVYNIDNIENDNLVLGSNSKYLDTDLEVEPGEISHSLSIDPLYELPICIEEEDIAALNAAIDLKLTVKGGYDPVDGTVDVMQVVQFYWDSVVSKGQFGLDFISLGSPADCDCCSCEEFDVVFTFIEKICLVSTQLPTVGPCWTVYNGDYCDEKDVDLCMDIDWLGCWFSTILASNLHFP